MKTLPEVVMKFICVCRSDIDSSLYLFVYHLVENLSVSTLGPTRI